MNVGITTNNVNLIRDSSRKIFWLWRWSSTLLFKLFGHCTTKLKRIIRGNTFIVDWDIMRVISYVDRRDQVPRVRSVEYNSERFPAVGKGEGWQA